MEKSEKHRKNGEEITQKNMKNMKKKNVPIDSASFSAIDDDDVDIRLFKFTCPLGAMPFFQFIKTLKLVNVEYSSKLI